MALTSNEGLLNQPWTLLPLSLSLYPVLVTAPCPCPRIARFRTAPSYDDGYVWSPEIYGKDTVRGMAHMWWSLPVNKYNCWSCCVGNSERIIPDSPACSSLTGHACRRGLLPMLDAQDMGNASLPGFSAEGHGDYGGPGGWNHLDQLAACVGKSWYG